MPWLVAFMLGARLVAALVLVFGPATDSVEELRGWDAARFHAIATADGRHWVDHAVEYPPGSVVIAEVLAPDRPDGVVTTNRRLVLASLVIDLALALVVHRNGGRAAAITYLALGTLMIPMGLLRLDLWAALMATIALVELRRRRALGFAVAVTLGWSIKVFPALLVGVAFALRSWRTFVAAIALSASATALWVWYGGIAAIEQMLSLRDVTGWHLESVPGSIVALLSDERPRFEADAFRIGSLDPTVVLAGRLLTGAVALGFAWFASRCDRAHRDDAATLMTLGTIATLIVTAPLLSPQFLLWLSPFAALLVRRAADLRRPEVALTALAMAITSATLAWFGPPGLDQTVAAAALLVRDGCLVGIIGAVGWRLWSLGPRADGTIPAPPA
jgi:hypothetical protein